MQADQITSFVFSKLIRQARGKELLDLLDFLEAHVYSKLEAAYQPTIRKLQVSYAMQGWESPWRCACSITHWCSES